MTYDTDYILTECGLAPLKTLVSDLEARHRIEITRSPSVGLVMIPAEDSLSKQPFYLGEAIITECDVVVDDHPGFGVCLGDDPARSYCMAVLDSLLHQNRPPSPDIESFLAHHGRAIAEKELRNANLVLRTQVDFKLMENE